MALFITGIAAIAALEAVGGELRSLEKAQRALEAEALAEYQMAMTQMLFYEDFQSFPDSMANGYFPEPFSNYSWRTAVVPVVNEENLFQVDMDVAGPDGPYKLSTMVYRRPQTFAAGGGRGGGGGRDGGGGDRGGDRRGGDGGGDRGNRGGNEARGERGGRGRTAARGGAGRGRAGGPGRGPGRTGGPGSGTGRTGGPPGTRTTTRDSTIDTTTTGRGGGGIHW